MVYPDTFKGFQIEDPNKWTDFKLNDLKPKPFGDYDVDIKIEACGVCASGMFLWCEVMEAMLTRW